MVSVGPEGEDGEGGEDEGDEDGGEEGGSLLVRAAVVLPMMLSMLKALDILVGGGRAEGGRRVGEGPGDVLGTDGWGDVLV